MSRLMPLVVSLISEEHHLAVQAVSCEMCVTEIPALVSQFEMAALGRPCAW